MKKRVLTEVDPELWHQARVFSVQHNMRLSALVEEALREYLKKKGGEMDGGEGKTEKA